jgi:hypothetical protein
VGAQQARVFVGHVDHHVLALFSQLDQFFILLKCTVVDGVDVLFAVAGELSD